MTSNTVQKLGFVLVILGIILILVGLIWPVQMYNCPAGGCPPGFPPDWWVPSALFISGIVLVALGIILLVVARNMTLKREKATLTSSEKQGHS